MRSSVKKRIRILGSKKIKIWTTGRRHKLTQKNATVKSKIVKKSALYEMKKVL